MQSVTKAEDQIVPLNQSIQQQTNEIALYKRQLNELREQLELTRESQGNEEKKTGEMVQTLQQLNAKNEQLFSDKQYLISKSEVVIEVQASTGIRRSRSSRSRSRSTT